MEMLGLQPEGPGPFRLRCQINPFDATKIIRKITTKVQTGTFLLAFPIRWVVRLPRAGGENGLGKNNNPKPSIRGFMAIADPDPGVGGKIVGLVIAIIFVFVLIAITAGLLGPLKTQLTKYAANDTTFGPAVQTLMPILIGAAIVVVAVVVLLAFARTRAM